MTKDTHTTADRTVAQLCAEVDYWRNRAEKAEHELTFEREQQIRQHPELWESYVRVMSLWGGKPADDLRPVA